MTTSYEVILHYGTTTLSNDRLRQFYYPLLQTYSKGVMCLNSCRNSHFKHDWNKFGKSIAWRSRRKDSNACLNCLSWLRPFWYRTPRLASVAMSPFFSKASAMKLNPLSSLRRWSDVADHLKGTLSQAFSLPGWPNFGMFVKVHAWHARHCPSLPSAPEIEMVRAVS